MGIPGSKNDREYRSWEEDTIIPGDTRRKVTALIDPSQYPISIKGLLGDIVFDAVSEAEPDNVTEVYSFFTGGLSGTLVATVTVTYANSSKKRFVSAVRT